MDLWCPRAALHSCCPQCSPCALGIPTATTPLGSRARRYFKKTNEPGQHSFLLQETYATGSLVNELRLGYSRSRAFLQPADVTVNPATIFTDAAGNPLPGYIDTRADPLDGRLPRITITGFTNGGLGVGTGMPQGRAQAQNICSLRLGLSLRKPLASVAFLLQVVCRTQDQNAFDSLAESGLRRFVDLLPSVHRKQLEVAVAVPMAIAVTAKVQIHFCARGQPEF